MADNTTDIHDLLVTLGWDPVEHKQKFTDTLKNKKLVVALRAFKDQVCCYEVAVERNICWMERIFFFGVVFFF
jgi:hypothetical protein